MTPETTLTLGPKAQNVIDSYLSLPVGTKPSCPYFNNMRKRIRGGLRVIKGKGTPKEIAEECEIHALQQRVSLASLSTDKLKQFLVEHDLGIDCSGFAYHVLNAHLSETKGKGVIGSVKPIRKGFLGKVIARLRPAENIGVTAFAHESNSTPISVAKAQAGDIITLIGTGKNKTYNHILVVTNVTHREDGTHISYAHSYAWPADGLYDHGVRKGEIIVHGNDILGGTWKEKGVIGSENYTFESARTATMTTLRRLNILMK